MVQFVSSTNCNYGKLEVRFERISPQWQQHYCIFWFISKDTEEPLATDQLLAKPTDDQGMVEVRF